MSKKPALSGVTETMLQTIYARAKETKTRGAIKDGKAVEIIDSLDYDFSLADKDSAMHNGVIARTIVLDRLAGKFLRSHPGAVVVNIACGLDTRCYRMKGYSHWYNLDLPETIEVRRSILPPTEKITQIAMSAMDDWGGEIAENGVTVYGVVDGSKFVDAEIPAGKALVSTGVSVKFGLNSGDFITLDEKYKRDASYKLDIAGVYDYESSLAVFMNIDDFARTFGEEEGYFTGYFSNAELTELPDDDVATVITASDYTKLSTQLMVSMGGMMNLIKWFGALFFIIVVYVLCKQVIERNFQSIAMTKILGFRNGEIGMLYIASTTIAVIVGLLISIPFIDVAMKLIVNGYLYTMMTGYLPLSMSPMTYVVMFFTGLGCYIVVAFLQMRKVARVSKSEALKNAE